MLRNRSATDRSVVIIVLSSRGNFIRRKLVRQTYGSIKSANNIHILGIVFLVGSMDSSGYFEVDHSELEAENMEYGDLIMGDFVDTYRNLTRKTIMAYEWLTTFCCEAQLVLKTDDDIMVNVFRLTELLNSFSATEMTSSNIWCEIQNNETYITNELSQFYVPPFIFPNDVFPPHCGGSGYVTTMAVIHRIANEISKSFVERVCTHEDVFMTAIVPQEINANLKAGGQQDDFIELIDTSTFWITYALELLKGEDAGFLINILEQPANETVDYDKFRGLYGKNIFYLLRHNEEFEQRYAKLWEVIEVNFRNGMKDEDGLAEN